MSTDDQTDTPASPDAIWRTTVIEALNQRLGIDLTESSDAYTVANCITTGIDAVRIECDELRGKIATVTTERDSAQGALIGARSLYGTLLDAERGYYRTIADRLGIPYETATDAAALCDALAPGIAQLGACRIVIACESGDLPDVLLPDDDGQPPSPACAIRRLADALRVARAEADSLRSALAATQADLRATDRARDSWRDAAGTTAKALSAAAAALADVAAIR